MPTETLTEPIVSETTTQEPRAVSLPPWIRHTNETHRGGEFERDCDAAYEALCPELGYDASAELDQYQVRMLELFANKDGDIAMRIYKLATFGKDDGVNLVRPKLVDRRRFGMEPSPDDRTKRGWMEYEEVELTPDENVKKGETIHVGGVPHVCIEEDGCMKRKGGMESGLFRREVFHERPAGKGVKEAEKDFPQRYRDLRPATQA